MIVYERWSDTRYLCDVTSVLRGNDKGTYVSLSHEEEDVERVVIRKVCTH